MARRKKNPPLIQPKTPLESAIVLLLALPWCLWGIIKEYPIQSILVIGAIVALVVHIIQKNKRQRIANFRAFYNRETRLKFLNNDGLIDQELTNKILSAQQNGTTVQIGGKSDPEREELYRTLSNAYMELDGSEGRVWGSLDQLSLSSNYIQRSLSVQNGISVQRTPLVFNFWGSGNGDYSFYVFPETVLAFFEGKELSVFLAAFDPEAVVVYCKDAEITKEVVVNEKSQEAIRYYDKFCPYSDTEILDSYWKVTNKDGSRSFKGGLLPENNPLTFKLRFQRMTMEFGDYKVMTAYSNNQAAQHFEEAYDHFKWDLKPVIPLGQDKPVLMKDIDKYPTPDSSVHDEVNEENYDDSFTRTDASVNDVKTPDVVSVESEEPAPVPPMPKKTMVAAETNTNIEESEPVNEPIIESIDMQEAEVLGTDDETETVRTRNRELAKSAVDELNKNYAGKYDFKTYQVRKPREGWNLQDAGVYTYVNDNEGNQYTIEFDLITDLVAHKSAVRFSIWGKSKEMVANRYKITVSKGKMSVNGEGYTVLIKRDYENMSTSDMSAGFNKDCMTLMRLVSYDDPK